MKNIIVALILSSLMAACSTKVDSGSFFPDLPGMPGNDSPLSAGVLIISDINNPEYNVTEYSNVDGHTEIFVKSFLVEIDSDTSLSFGGASHFSMGCNLDPVIKMEVVVKDTDGTEISRDEVSWNNVDLKAENTNSVEVSMSGIDSSCMSISHNFSVSAE